MYLIDQEVAREITKEGSIKPLEIYNLFMADNEEEAEILEQRIRWKITKKTGNSQIGRAVTIYSPLLWANKAITSYILRTGDQSLRAVAPEVLTAEETALLAQRDLMLDDEELLILIEQLRLQGTEDSQANSDTSDDYIRVFSYSDLRRFTQKIRDKKHQIAIKDFIAAFLKENENQGPVKKEDVEIQISKPNDIDETTALTHQNLLIESNIDNLKPPPNQRDSSLLLIEQIRQIALTKGITQQAIADKTGFKRENVNRILSGKYMPRLDNFLKLCSAIDIQFSLQDQKDQK